MGLKDDLSAEVKSTFAQAWDVQKTESVPAPEDLRLNANHAKDLEKATVLYADLDGSTSMVDNYKWEFSAEIYKTFLRCASQIIRSEGGAITAYDGDRVMAIFTGGTKNTDAVRCALKINYAVSEIIQPAINAQYTTDFKLSHVVGIDTSQLRTSRIGVRGDNDLVWIGRAANYAAKLTNESGKPTWITKTVYDSMKDDVKFHNGQDMWQKAYWTSMNNMEVYSSTYWWMIP
ncbi:adenylate/guanylate cyclase domain-containing protein [Paucibacter sp. PLA-PC-4]|uniref:adenylate/guanylate cyclase domain-containing protein n=1 Tax=Paucibacter sp. PLA-PC-4 TaxID=2993655 RepID=UPI002248803B|nr:adenylate/guanylate cyclase domain-containing protein [Paucibacter sp. PLA-PC-4]